jgi:hypothetical protein
MLVDQAQTPSPFPAERVERYVSGRLWAGRALGWRGFWLIGAADCGSLLTRLDVGERLCSETSGLAVVDAPAAFTNDLALGLAAVRTDLVCPLPPT